MIIQPGRQYDGEVSRSATGPTLHLNLGAGPVAFAFVSPRGGHGRFLVQDS